MDLFGCGVFGIKFALVHKADAKGWIFELPKGVI